MMPIGPLMIEHRLIERMIPLLENQLEDIRESGGVDPVFIDNAVDFFRTYADRTHHGKEEDILFRDLAAKEINLEDRRTMDELVEEHVHARETVGGLLRAKGAFVAGDTDALETVVEHLEELARFYPGHIEKEDRHFFIPCMDYFSREEQDGMLQEFFEFDRDMIHEKYRRLIEMYQ
ncbi:MAG: hemerythrin domain-containing protein [Actinobacteria bacterium]|nr:hemerythrin domain-containing protein [Actinomycetota bacterium]